jgi:hypothetical protein
MSIEGQGNKHQMLATPYLLIAAAALLFGDKVELSSQRAVIPCDLLVIR